MPITGIDRGRRVPPIIAKVPPSDRRRQPQASNPGTLLELVPALSC